MRYDQWVELESFISPYFEAAGTFFADAEESFGDLDIERVVITLQDNISIIASEGKLFFYEHETNKFIHHFEIDPPTLFRIHQFSRMMSTEGKNDFKKSLTKRLSMIKELA